MAVVVIAEDDPDIRAALELNLTLDGHDVHPVADGTSAIETVRRLRPDVVLLDVRMPGRDGFATCRALKDDPATAAVAVVLLTAAAGAADRRRGEEAGADAFVTKPFAPAELAEQVRRLAGGDRPGRRPPP